MPEMTTPPMIAHVVHRLYLAGAEVLAAALARKLSAERAHAAGESRYRFAFFCLDEIGPLGEALAAEGFPVVDLKRRPGVDLTVPGRIARACRELGVSLLHAHQYTPFFYASMSRAWPTALGPLLASRPPILFTEHGRHYPDYRRPKRIWANKLLLGSRDRVTAVGQWVRQALVDNEGIASRRIEVIHNGIDPAQFTPADDDARRQVRTELGISDDQVAIMQVARFHPVKDHLTAIRAMATLTKQAPQAVLVLVGDGDERPAIEACIDDLGVSQRVRLLGVRSDVPRLTAAADIFLLSSLSEGISVTLLEAMGAGLPIVATDVGGNSEIVSHDRTGLLAPRRDHDALADCLLTLVRNPGQRRRFGEAGRQRLLQQFDQAHMHNRYAAVYRAMLDR